MSNNRGLSVAQAKSLAGDPTTAPGVLARLANTYPECWPELLRNPSLYPELRSWVEQASAAAQKEKDSLKVDTASKPLPAAKKQPERVVSTPRKVKSRGRKLHGRVFRGITVVVPAAIMVWALFAGVTYLDKNRPELGVVTVETLTVAPTDSPEWKYDLSVKGDKDCTEYELATLDQNQALVLTQNDIETKRCRDLKKPSPSTLALVNLQTGKNVWKIDFAAELEWTDKWKKQLVELPGLNEIIVKFIDVNGSDAGSNTKDVDKGDDRKMKTVVPYSRLNGRITDTAIAKSKWQPIMQAPVLNVLAIPNNVRGVMIMTNGAKKDFRYARYRSKRLSSPWWSVESNLRPMGGNPIVGHALILGRLKGDKPLGIDLTTGKTKPWKGRPAVKLQSFNGHYVQIQGDGVSEKATNLDSQGGTKGKDITLEGIDIEGNQLWRSKFKGYAISKDSSRTDLKDRRWYSQLFGFNGKDNQYLSKINPATGKVEWKTKLSQSKFELSRTNSASTIGLFLFAKNSVQTKKAALIDLTNGKQFETFAIAGKQVRVDGASTLNSLLIDEPERSRIIESAESGKRPSVNHEDNSDKTRKCIQEVTNEDGTLGWSYECNGNQHILQAGGRWLLLDVTGGSEFFQPLTKGRK